MLNLNDDMDDLIRQAAEDYPLKTEGKDWDKVAGAIKPTEVIVEPDKRKEYWWLLLLLLPLMVTVLYMNKNNNTQKPVAYSDTKKIDSATEKQNAGGPLNKNEESLNKDNKPAEQIAAGSNPGQQKNKMTDQEKQDGSRLSSDFDIKRTLPINNRSNNSADDIISKGKEIISDKSSINSSNNTIPDNSLAEDNSYKKSNGSNNSPAADSGLATPEQTKRNADKRENTSAKADSSSTNKVALAPQKDSAATTKRMDVKHTTPIKTKGLYVGIAAGLDATTVKFHNVNKIGYTTNLIIGYRINNNWSLESGIMWDNKNYFSPGDYFNKSKTGLSDDYNIHFLNGTCRMFEIPVNVKYDFRSRKLSGFFIAGGLSSYIMKKESYNGFVTHNSEPNVPGYYKQLVFKNATNNLFSVGNLSGGYQFIFKNNSSLRIEPYLKVPLTGLGIGQLPFLSTGISAAYTIPLH